MNSVSKQTTLQRGVILLASANVGYFLVVALSMNDHLPVILKLAWRLNALLGRSYINQTGSFLSVLTFTMPVLGLLSWGWMSLPDSRLTRGLMRYGAGVIALGSNFGHWVLSRDKGYALEGLLLICFIMVGLFVMYRMSRRHPWLALATLGAYFLTWHLVWGWGHYVHDPYLMSITVLSVSAAVAWVVYLYVWPSGEEDASR